MSSTTIINIRTDANVKSKAQKIAAGEILVMKKGKKPYKGYHA